jgi:hypothetical protein
MSRAQARLFFLGSQSKRILLGILQAEFSDFFTGISKAELVHSRRSPKIQRYQRAKTKTANSKHWERIPTSLLDVHA